MPSYVVQLFEEALVPTQYVFINLFSMFFELTSRVEDGFTIDFIRSLAESLGNLHQLQTLKIGTRLADPAEFSNLAHRRFTRCGCHLCVMPSLIDIA